MLRPSLLMITLLIGLSLLPPASAQPGPLPISIDLTVSLEWEPGDLRLNEILPADCSDRSSLRYSDDLRQGLRAAAAYLYSFTRGQITLGNVQIYSDGAQWEQADIRVLASSGYRPSAFVGGAIDQPTLREVTPGRRVLYYPGAIMLGRLWDGNPDRRGARCGPWSSPSGWRTLGHELAHHVLFLYDQYSALDGTVRRCTTSGLSSLVRPDLLGNADTLMTYHYSADELLLVSPADQAGCADTAHAHVYADRSEWQALRTAFPSLPETPPPPLRADLAALLAELDSRGLANVQLAAPVPTRDTTTALALNRLTRAEQSPVYAEVYMVERDPNNGLQRIIGQGWAVPGETGAPPLLGIAPENAGRAVAFVEDATNGLRYASPPSLSAAGLDPGTPANLTLTASVWRPQIRITPDLRPTLVLEDGVRATEVGGLQIEMQDCNRFTKTVELSYCPAGGRCAPPVQVEAGPGGIFRHNFIFPLTQGGQATASTRGYIHARESERGEETIVWYQIGGGVGPAHGDAHAPLVDGLLNSDLAAERPGPERDSRLLYSPTAVCTAPPAADSGVTLLGSPIRVEPVAATEQQSRRWGSDPADPALSVRLGYTPDLLARVGVDEDDLVLLRLNADNPQFPPFWEVLGPGELVGRDRDLDWLATQVPFRGEGAIVALGYRSTYQLRLPLLSGVR